MCDFNGGFRASYAESGFCDAIRNWLASIEVRPEIPGLSTGYKATFPAWCGDTDQAFELLDQALEEKSPELLYIRSSVVFDKLHDDPRFDELMRKLGLDKLDSTSPRTTP